MGLFNKRKEQEVARKRHEELLRELAKPPCEQVGGKHLWRDFPAYIVYKTDREGFIKIIEPYVCVYCKKRQERLLEQITYGNLSTDDAIKQKKQMDQGIRRFN